MKIPYKPVYLPKGPRKYNYIVIHDVNCMTRKFNDFKVDSNISQINLLRARLRQEKKWFELPYHFVCEKIKDDYETITARPLQYSCEDCYPDLIRKYSRFSVHICIMGNFNYMVGEPRMYQQLCYRAISPIMKRYRIPKSNIFLHAELNPSQLDCPGFNFSKDYLKAYIQPFLIAQNS